MAYTIFRLTFFVRVVVNKASNLPGAVESGPRKASTTSSSSVGGTREASPPLEEGQLSSRLMEEEEDAQADAKSEDRVSPSVSRMVSDASETGAVSKQVALHAVRAVSTGLACSLAACICGFLG